MSAALKKAKSSRLIVGSLIVLGAVSQASSGLADTVTRTFTTPMGPGVYTYDTSSNAITYTVGDPNSSSYTTGGFTFDPTTSTGTSYVTYVDNGNVGTSSQQFPITGFQTSYPSSTGTDSSTGSQASYPGATEAAGSLSSDSQQSVPSIFQDFLQPTTSGGSQADGGFTGTVTRPFSTPKGDGTYTYNGSDHSITYSLGDPNGTFYSSGMFQYDPNTFGGSSYGTYKDNGTMGVSYQNFGNSNMQAPPEFEAAVANAVGSSQIPSVNSTQTNTTTYNTPKGNVLFNYDPSSGKLTYSLGDPNSAFYSTGEFQIDPNTGLGNSYGLYKDNGSTGGYLQQFPVSNYDASQGFNFSNFLPSTNGSQTSSDFTGTVTRNFSTPMGDGIFTYDGSSHTITYSLGDPNGSFYSTGGFQIDPNTGVGTSYGEYIDNGSKGNFSESFGANALAVPEPNSASLDALAVAVISGTGLMLKRQPKKVRISFK
ncbi:MAG: hypothetical protein JOZ78_05335 [Chroococcidiopsidaceae cyanobacterium CP_BM_ER_R8_30]|nr:hypothetical protein [Chroococcidiopsidaceae cyanobacterium CP_BM_ER_R8_30]